MKVFILLFIFSVTACSTDSQKSDETSFQFDSTIPQFDVSVIDDGDHSEGLFPNGFDQGVVDYGALEDFDTEYFEDDFGMFGVGADFSQDHDQGVEHMNTDLSQDDDQEIVDAEVLEEVDASTTEDSDVEGDDFSMDAGQEMPDTEVLEAGAEIDPEEEGGEEPFFDDDRRRELGSMGDLQVTLISDPLQIVEELNLVDGDEVILAQYQFCATTEEDITIPAIELAFKEGMSLDVEFEFGDLVSVAYAVDFGRRLTIFRESGEEMVVTGNSCETVLIKTTLPADCTHVEVYIAGVVNTEDEMLYNGGQDWRYVNGVRTVFVLGDAYFLNIHSANTEVSSSAGFWWLTNFEIESMGNARVDISRLRFYFSTVGDVLPISYTLAFQEFGEDSFQLIHESNVFEDGEELVIDTIRPDGFSEDISFSGKLFIQFSLLFCPQDLVQFQIHLDSVEGNGSLLSFHEEPEVVTESPLAESPLFEVVEEVGLVPHLNLGYLGKYGANRSQYFLWSESGHDECDEQFRFDGVCPALGLGVGSVTPDQRFPVTFESLSFRVTGQGIQENLPFRVMVKTAAGGGNLLDEPIVFSQGNEEQVVTLEHSIDFQQENSEVWVFVYLDELPVEDLETLMPQEFSIEILEVEAMYLGNPAPVFIYAPTAPGNWPWGPQELPYAGPKMILASPEVWLESNPIGRPETVSIGDENRTEVELLEIEYSNERERVQLCDIVFAHNTEKDTPVFHSIEVRFGSETFTLSDWDRERAVFRVPEGFCHTIGNGWNDSMVVFGRNPSSSTNPGQPLQLELIEFGMQPLRAWEYGMSLEGQEYDVPFIVGYENRHKILLGEDDARRVRGRIVNIIE